MSLLSNAGIPMATLQQKTYHVRTRHRDSQHVAASIVMGLEPIVSRMVSAGRIWRSIEVHAQTRTGNLMPVRNTVQALVSCPGLDFGRCDDLRLFIIPQRDPSIAHSMSRRYQLHSNPQSLLKHNLWLLL